MFRASPTTNTANGVSKPSLGQLREGEMRQYLEKRLTEEVLQGLGKDPNAVSNSTSHGLPKMQSMIWEQVPQLPAGPLDIKEDDVDGQRIETALAVQLVAQCLSRK
jgi:hypothetical protein